MHQVLAFAAAAEDQNGEELRGMMQDGAGRDGDMGPGIAWAAYVAGKAAR